MHPSGLRTIIIARLLSLTMACASIAHATSPPYPPSKTITAMTWDFSTAQSLRKAVGSDLWPLTWASDGNLYGAWGDGGGFNGTEANKSTGRASLGFARISGVPIAGDPSSYSGQNVWGQAPKFAEHQATFGGKVDELISVGGVLYGWGGLWTAANCGCSDPTIKSSDNPTQRTMVWSTDLGATWHIAPWTSRTQAGGSLQFGQDYRGAFDPSHVYYYYNGDINVDPTHAYLRRVRTNALLEDPATPGHFEYFAGMANGSPMWTTTGANAAPVFTDPNSPAGVGTFVGVVYDGPLGRYIATEGHGNSAGQMGYFEAPEPWGPWSTIGYYNDWGGFNESAGLGNGLQFPSKWISADGKTLWAVFSGTNHGAGGAASDFDSFNVVKVVLTTGVTAPQITVPAAQTVLHPGEQVTATGVGSSLAWSATLSSGTKPFATGAGSSFTFTVPDNAIPSDHVRIELTGRGGTAARDYVIAIGPGVTIEWVSTSKPYRLATAEVGAVAYIDRTYTITALSRALTGGTLIQSANDDKFVTSSKYLQLRLGQAATVYVCFRPVKQLPAWITDGSWMRTSETCDFDDRTDNARWVYKRSVPAGDLMLGGNREPPATDPARYSNYVVIVRP